MGLKEAASATDGNGEMNLAPDTPRLRTRRRIAFVFVSALALLASTAVQPPEPVAASADQESAFVTALNEVRADNGLAPFTVNGELADLAREHARVMAEAGEIFHANPISAGYTGPWAKLGENVGVGASVEVLVDAFVASPGHFANIVDPSFTEIGVGVVWLDDAMYTTHRFLQLPGVTDGSTPSSTVPSSTVPPTTVPPPPTEPTTTSARPTSDGPAAPLPDPPITAERVLALLDLLDRVGT